MESIPKLVTRHSWSSMASSSMRRGVFAGLVMTLFITISYFFSPAEILESLLQRRAEFSIRHLLGRDPELDPRIRIYSLGDTTFDFLNEEELKLTDWTQILNAIAPMKPGAVLIDKVFANPPGVAASSDFVSALKSLKFPVIGGAFIAPSAIGARPRFRPYQLSELSGVSTQERSRLIDSWSWLKITSGYSYGPHPKVRDGFRFVGHQMYSENDFFTPLIRLARDEVLPAASLSVGKERHFEKGKIAIDGHDLPMDKKGRALINFSHPSYYSNRAYKLSRVIEKARIGKPIDDLPENAIVVILPMMYTGHTDLHDTPFGKMAGGFINVALVNSVLTGNWISMMSNGWVLILLSGLVGSLIVQVSTPILFWLLFFFTPIVITGMGLFSFTYFDLELPWLFCSLNVFISTFVATMVQGESLQRRISWFGPLLERRDSKRRLGSDINPEDFTSVKPFNFGQYQLIDLLGKGGMGEVFRVKSIGWGGFEKEFAIKRILPGHWPDPQLVTHFEAEARVNSILSHPNIVQVYQFIRTNESYLLVMEYVDGPNLAQLIKNLRVQGSTLGIPLSTHIVIQVCKALEYAHNRRDPTTQNPLDLVHRDISPHNIMLSRQGEVKVIDFGIAKGNHREELTAVGVVKGKMGYMSPEQRRGDSLDRRTDIYSTGLVLYELLTHKQFHNISLLSKDTNIPSEGHSRLDNSITEMGVHDKLRAILRRALSETPEGRYPTARELSLDLERFMASVYPSFDVEELVRIIQKVVPPQQSIHPPDKKGLTPLSDVDESREVKGFAGNLIGKFQEDMQGDESEACEDDEENGEKKAG